MYAHTDTSCSYIKVHTKTLEKRVKKILDFETTFRKPETSKCQLGC